MTYANWRFEVQGLSELHSSFHLDNDPGPNSDLYLQLYDAPIDGTPMYHGVQTTNLAIFSRFGTTDLNEVRAAEGAEKVAGTDEGPFISLRMPFSLGVGSYSATLRRAEGDERGDWFEFSVGRQHGETATSVSEDLVGAIRFPRRHPDIPAAMADGGGSWTEFWDNNGPVLHEVPLWGVRLDPPVADGRPARGVVFRYSTMPNSSIWWDEGRRQVMTVLGADTKRRRAPMAAEVADTGRR